MNKLLVLVAALSVAGISLGQTHDVGVVSVDSPPDIVEPGSVCVPLATVQNYGDSIETFTVICVLWSYFSQCEVDSLEPDSAIQVSFTPWIVPSVSCTRYSARVFTTLPADSSPGNDTLVKTVLAATHELAAISSREPPDTVFTDSTYFPILTTANLGFAAETFDVECLIDSQGQGVYGDTTPVESLIPSISFPCTLGMWTVPPSDSTTYTITYSLLATDDCEPLNNSLERTVFALSAVGARETPLGPIPRGSRHVLFQNTPNPFSRRTEIRYLLSATSGVRLNVYDVSGSLVSTLTDMTQGAGIHHVTWKPEDLHSGVYFCQLEVGEFRAVTEMILLR